MVIFFKLFEWVRNDLFWSFVKMEMSHLNDGAKQRGTCGQECVWQTNEHAHKSIWLRLKKKKKNLKEGSLFSVNYWCCLLQQFRALKWEDREKGDKIKHRKIIKVVQFRTSYI